MVAIARVDWWVSWPEVAQHLRAEDWAWITDVMGISRWNALLTVQGRSSLAADRLAAVGATGRGEYAGGCGVHLELPSLSEVQASVDGLLARV